MKVMCELCVEELANVKDDTPRIRNHADSHDESPSSLIRPTIIIRVVIYIIISAGMTLTGWRKQSIILAASGSIILFAVLVAELFFHEREQQRIGSNKLPILVDKTTSGRMKNEVVLPIVAEEKVSEFSSLIHSDSLAGSGSDSDFADNSIILTEGYLRKLKYDSLQKYVKDW
jgi:hypothetical protein